MRCMVPRWNRGLSISPANKAKAPDPYYDPLQFWIEESHKRGIRVARVVQSVSRAAHVGQVEECASSHFNTHPSVVKSYGGFLWMDPGEPVSAQRTLDVILDVVRRYDVDGVHIDDYFYPYPVNVPGSMPPVEIDFPTSDRGTSSWPKAGHWIARHGGDRM